MSNSEITEEEYWMAASEDLWIFMQLCFYELNPGAEYYQNWHHELLACSLEAILRGEIRRQIICVPPRSLKSIFGNVAFTAYLLGHNPSCHIISVSYNQELAEKHAADCRLIMNSNWYKRIFPNTRLARQTAQELVTTKNGTRWATSVGGTLTGRGADFVIIDDPLKPEEAVSDAQRNLVNNWFGGTLYSRLNDKKTGSIIIIAQRLHMDDLVGHVLEQSDDWNVLSLPAIAEEPEAHIIRSSFGTRTAYRKVGEALHEEREPLPVLKDIRKNLGMYNFDAQYQQRPGPAGGALVKLGWFNYYEPGEEPSKFDLVFQSWDSANKATELSDYSVCTTWGMKRKKLYLLHVLRERLQYPDLKRAVLKQRSLFKPTNILIEDKASGTQLIQELIRDGEYGITKYDPKDLDKIMRMHSVTTTIENHFVYLPTEAPWLDGFLAEVGAFPKSKYKDQVDSLSQALHWATNRPYVTGLMDYEASEIIRLRLPRPSWMGTDYDDDEPEQTGTETATGRKLRWNGKDWVFCDTGEICQDE